MGNQTLARGLAVVGLFGVAVCCVLRAYTMASAETVVIPQQNILAIAGWPQGKDKLERLSRLALDEPSLRARLADEGAGSWRICCRPIMAC